MHNHSHGHGHDHHHEINYNKAFILGIGLNIGYVIIETVYGLLVNSLALLADAGHNLSDVLGLVIAWVASYLVQKKPTKTYTYGFKKSTILAAFINALILLVAIGGIGWEAIGRFTDPQPVEGHTVMIVAGIGAVINTLTALLFMRGRKSDLNIKGAFMHMAADAGVSIGVVIAGLLIVYTEMLWLDPLVSIIIAIVIFIGTWSLLKESTSLALDAVPKAVNQYDVKSYLSNLEGVEDVHDLHIWAMSTTETALTVHLVIPKATVSDDFTNEIAYRLKEKFKIQHSTIQIENGKRENGCEFDCG